MPGRLATGRRLSLSILLPASLMALVVVFAALQYRWLGQVSEADREQMRRSIAERARQFADDFNREISAIYSQLPIKGDIADGAASTLHAERIERWRGAARFPEIVRDVYAVSVGSDTLLLYRFSPDRRKFETTDWPDSLAPVRARLLRTAQDTLVTLDIGRSDAGRDRLVPAPLAIPRLTPFVLDVPALVIPPLPTMSLYTIVEFDANAIRRRVLPALAAEHLLQPGDSGYNYVILDEKNAPLLSSAADAEQIRAETADGSAALFQLPTEGFSTVIIRGRSSGRDARSAGSPLAGQRSPEALSSEVRSLVEFSDRSRNFLPVRASWTLLVQHPTGSINAAVTAARRRNLWISFGILSLLTAGIALVLVNARRSEQLAAQQMDFVATVSHELRTPVAVMRSAAQNLSAGVVHDPDRARMYGELIEAEGRRLTDMVEQVLEFAGVDGHQAVTPLVVTDPVEIAVEAAAGCRPLVESCGLTLEIDVPEPMPSAGVVMGHPEGLRRAVTNLITNAVKYGADGGWIGVAVRPVLNRGKGSVEIIVSDRGRGVDPVDLPKLFEPFFRGKYAIDRQIQGNGLGLSLVRRLAEAYGGSVRAQSNPGQGATFIIELPVVETESETAPAAAPSRGVAI